MKPSDRIIQLSRKLLPDDIELSPGAPGEPFETREARRWLIARQRAMELYLDELWQQGLIPE